MGPLVVLGCVTDACNLSMVLESERRGRREGMSGGAGGAFLYLLNKPPASLSDPQPSQDVESNQHASD